VKNYLQKNAKALRETSASATLQPLLADAATNLQSLAESVTPAGLEDLERRLTVMEDKLFAALLASAADAELLAVRSEADRDIAPYRSKMSGAQIEQLHRQYVNKRLLERSKLPRLSLFYM
jgi:hypothetical protein